MPDPHHDAGELWDRSDVAALRTYRRRGWTYQECAAALGRTVNAVRTKLYRLRQANGES